MITDKIINLEQTVVQRLRWAAGANPLVQDVLIKFEIRQKERMNEIDVCREKSFFLFFYFLILLFRMINNFVHMLLKFFNHGYFLNNMKNKLNSNKI